MKIVAKNIKIEKVFFVANFLFQLIETIDTNRFYIFFLVR